MILVDVLEYSEYHFAMFLFWKVSRVLDFLPLLVNFRQRGPTRGDVKRRVTGEEAKVEAKKRPAASHREAGLNRDNAFIIAALSFILRARGPRSSFLLRFLPAKDPLSTEVGGSRQPVDISVSLAKREPMCL